MLGEEVKKWGRLKKCGYENPLGWRLAPGRESGRIDRALLEFRRNYVVGRTESNLSNSECLKKKSKTHFKCGQRKLTPSHKAQHHGLWEKKKWMKTSFWGAETELIRERPPQPMRRPRAQPRGPSHSAANQSVTVVQPYIPQCVGRSNQQESHSDLAVGSAVCSPGDLDHCWMQFPKAGILGWLPAEGRVSSLSGIENNVTIWWPRVTWRRCWW